MKPPANNDVSTLNTHNNKLENYGLHNFHHKLAVKLLTFSHKIINESKAPIELKKQLKSSDKARVRSLRNQHNFITAFATNNIHSHTFSLGSSTVPSSMTSSSNVISLNLVF